MKAQYDNQVASSFLLWLENRVTSKGEAFDNHASLFYPTDDHIGGLYSYSAPFKPFVADSSISGANVMTGVYINGVFSTTGQSGLYDIDYANGAILTTLNLDAATISGEYAVQEIYFDLTDKPDSELLFETKYHIRPRVDETPTGLLPEEFTYPSVFVRNAGSKNTPFEFGGTDMTNNWFRVTCVADSQFMIDAIGSICRDAVRCHVPLIEGNEMPFNDFGGFKGNGSYNYDTLVSGKTLNNQSMFITEANVTDYTSNKDIVKEIRNLNPDIYVSIIEFKMEKQRTSRVS